MKDLQRLRKLVTTLQRKGHSELADSIVDDFRLLGIGWVRERVKTLQNRNVCVWEDL